jgi:hypothetical protein
MKSNFEVVACNANSTGGFVWKLAIKTVVVVFGITKTITRTYYIGGMPSAVAVGTKLEEDLHRFEVIERPFEFINDDNEKDTIMLKWLHAKAA